MVGSSGDGANLLWERSMTSVRTTAAAITMTQRSPLLRSVSASMVKLNTRPTITTTDVRSTPQYLFTMISTNLVATRDQAVSEPDGGTMKPGTDHTSAPNPYARVTNHVLVG